MKRKNIVGLIAILAIVAVAMFAGCVEEEAPTPTSTKVWTYKIFSEEDVSVGNTIRVVERASVPRNITEEGVKAVAKEIAQKVIASRDVNAIGIFFYYKPEASPEYCIGRVDWAPYGVWSKATEVPTGDYSKHEYNYDFFMDLPLPPPPAPTPAPTREPYEAGYSGDYATLSVTVRSPTKSLDVILKDSDGNILDTRYISVSSTSVGKTYSTWLDMTKATHKGEYILVIQESLGNKVLYQENFTFEGPNLEITGLGYDTHDWGDVGKGYSVEEITVTMHNSGDLHAHVARVSLTIDGKSHNYSEDWTIKRNSYDKKEIIMVQEFITGINMRKGAHPVMIVLYDEAGNKLCQAEDQLEL